MEERLDRDKKELKEHIDAAQIRLDKKVTSLEVKTRSQLNEITRSMALERVKCQQRHLHLEQWLIRGSIFRNSEKPKPTEYVNARISKSKSLENILEENRHCPTRSDNNKFHRSVDVLNDQRLIEIEKEKNEDFKNRSSSREGKESGKGSSEIEELGSTDGEDNVDGHEKKHVQRLRDLSNHERKMQQRTREISERIDRILENNNNNNDGDNEDGMNVIYDEMLKWKSYHNAYSERRNPIPAGKQSETKENQRIPIERQPQQQPQQQQQHQVLHRPQTQWNKSRHLENRRSYHDILRDEDRDANGRKEEEEDVDKRTRRLSDPSLGSAVEEPERKSVQEIISKLQRQHTVQELVAKIQKKTGLIHKSAQKWKENKLLKSKEKTVKYFDAENDVGLDEDPTTRTADYAKLPHNYENIRQWDVPKEKLSQLPYRCRNTVYSPSFSKSPPLNDPEYQRRLQHESPKRGRGAAEEYIRRGYERRRTYEEDPELLRGDDNNSTTADMGNELYGYVPSSGMYHHDPMTSSDPRKTSTSTMMMMMRRGERPTYSPTPNDSGYSTKPYGGSSTGPSPSLSGERCPQVVNQSILPCPNKKQLINNDFSTGQDFDSVLPTETPPQLPIHLQKSLEGRTSSLV